MARYAPAGNVDGYRLAQDTISAVDAGDNTLVSAPGAGKVICVHHIFISANAAVTIDFTDGAGGTVLVENIKLADTGGFEMGPWDKTLFPVSANTALVANANAANAVYGTISYTIRDV